MDFTNLLEKLSSAFKVELELSTDADGTFYIKDKHYIISICGDINLDEYKERCIAFRVRRDGKDYRFQNSNIKDLEGFFNECIAFYNYVQK